MRPRWREQPPHDVGGGTPLSAPGTSNAQDEGGDVPESEFRPAPQEWKPIWVQVKAPDPATGFPGIIAEGRYIVLDGELYVETQGKRHIRPLMPGDDPAAAARRLLRELHAKQHVAF